MQHKTKSLSGEGQGCTYGQNKSQKWIDMLDVTQLETVSTEKRTLQT